jgi:hypothetical protein
VAGIYRPRHPERTVLYRVLFHYFEQFLTEYESRFEREYGFFRPIIKEVIERYLDCGNPRCGFARIRCPDCGEKAEEVERMDYLEFIARVTAHIPDKGQVSLEGELTSSFQRSLRSLSFLLGLRPATKRAYPL